MAGHERGDRAGVAEQLFQRDAEAGGQPDERRQLRVDFLVFDPVDVMAADAGNVLKLTQGNIVLLPKRDEITGNLVPQP